MKKLLASLFLLLVPAFALAQFSTQQGGTGTTSPFGILIGDSTLHLKTLTIGTNLTLTGTTLSANAGSASTTLLGDTNTFSGTDTFNNLISGSVSGNAGTVTSGVYTTTFNGLFDARFITDLAATTSVKSIITLSSLSLPYTQLTGTPTSLATSTLLGDSNTFSGVLNIFSNTIKVAALSGLVGGNAGTLYSVSTSSLNASITGSAASVANALTINSPLTGSSYNGSSGVSIGIQAAGASQNGYLSSTDYSLLHAATTTFSSPLSYTNTTNAVTCPTCNTSNATVSSVATTYPVTGGTFTTTGTIALAFGTTTSNTWANTQTFTNPIVDASLSGLIGGNNGTTYAVSTSSLNASISGSAGSVANALTFNNSGSGAASGQTFNGSAAVTISYNTIGALSTTSPWTVGQLAYVNSGSLLTSVATSTITFNGGLSTSGTAGFIVGGSSFTAFLANINGNSVLGCIGSAACQPTSLATSSLFTFSPAFANNAGLTQSVFYQSFIYATSTAWTGTTTMSLEVAYGETWTSAQCFTDAGTVNVDLYEGSPKSANKHMQFFNASTTIGTVNFASFVMSTATTTRVDIGTPASSPTQVTCTIKKLL